MISGIRRRLASIKIKKRTKQLNLCSGYKEHDKYREQPHRLAKKRPLACPVKHCTCCHPGKYDDKIPDDDLVGFEERYEK